MNMRRGLEKQTLIALLVLMVTVIVLWPILGNAASWIQGYTDGGSCGASVSFASFKKEAVCIDVVNSPFALNCPRKNVVIDDAITVNFKGKQTTIPGEVDAATLEQFMLSELKNCWDKFGEGRIPLFQEANPGTFKSIYSFSTTACHICSEVHIKDAAVVSLQRALSEKIPGEEFTYRQHFNQPETLCESSFNGACWDNLENYFVEEERMSRIDILQPDTTYAVVMLRKRFDNCENVDPADSDLSLFSYIVPQEELNSLCDVVVS